MNIIYESKSTATKEYPQNEQKVIDWKGREYKIVGESFLEISLGQRIWKAVQYLLSVTIGAPWLFSSSKQKSLKVLGEEVLSGKVRLYHYVRTYREEKSWVASSASKLKPALSTMCTQKANSIKVFAALKFEKGSLCKEFIIKDASTAARLDNQMDKIQAKVEEIVFKSDPGVSPQTSMFERLEGLRRVEWLVMVKDAKPNLFYSVASYVHAGGEGTTAYGPAKANAILSSYDDFIEKIGFPKEDQFVNGEFAVGSNFVPLT